MKIVILLLSFVFISCVSTRSSMPLIQSISVEEAKKIIDQRRPSRLLLIDGRSEQMYESGHIKGATLIDVRQENSKENLSSALGYRAIMVYCSTNNRTAEIVTILQELGFRGKIFTITDGINAWRKAGFEIVTD